MDAIKRARAVMQYGIRRVEGHPPEAAATYAGVPMSTIYGWFIEDLIAIREQLDGMKIVYSAMLIEVDKLAGSLKRKEN